MSNIEYYSTLLELFNEAQGIYELYPQFREITFTQTLIEALTYDHKDYLFTELTKFEELTTKRAIEFLKILGLDKVEIKMEDDFEDVKERYPNHT